MDTIIKNKRALIYAILGLILAAILPYVLALRPGAPITAGDSSRPSPRTAKIAPVSPPLTVTATMNGMAKLDGDLTALDTSLKEMDALEGF